MANDLADYQAETIARGYSHNFSVEARTASSDIADELRIVEYRSFDTGTDPGDDVTMYLIESTGGLQGYLILSDSFHVDPQKAALIDALLANGRVIG
ncbi:MAG: phosphoribosylpyrophosphate synthetase [Proteobacteria bacterium]|nr:phosphoribosylpyrophosphate synthetase [Pseudomonadota bacterium]